MSRAQRIVLGILISAGALFRFWRINDLTFVQDEYSTLFRTGYSSLGALIEKGVMADVHPAGVQVFMHFYTALFGYQTWVVKLPFALMGLASLYLVFDIGRRFFGNSAALLATSVIAVSQYMLQYSHSIRPYISGMFLVLLMVWALSRIHSGDARRRWWWLFAFAAAGAAYNHYFSLLSAGIIAVSVPLILPFSQIKNWMLFSACALLLYVPHLPVFAHHFTKGSPGDWLPPPTSDYLLQYFNYVGMYSPYFSGLLMLIVLGGAVFFIRNIAEKWKVSVLMFFWFFIPFAVGFAYSVLRAPMLQYSVLIFGFPFLILALFSFWGNQRRTLSSALALCILCFSAVQTVWGRSYFQHTYQDPLREAFELHRYPMLLRSSETHYAYAERRGFDLRQVHLSPLDFADSDSMALLWLEKQNTDTIELLWFWQRDQNLLSKMVLHYPRVLEYRSYYLADYYRLARGDERDFNCSNPADRRNWRISNGIDSMKLYAGIEEFPLEYKGVLGDWFTHGNDRVHVSVETCRISNGALLVADIRTADSVLHYQVTPLKTTRSGYPGFDALHLQFSRDFIAAHSDAQMALYIWNRSKDTIEVSDMRVCRHVDASYHSPNLHWIYE
jgi:hypothetical protein